MHTPDFLHWIRKKQRHGSFVLTICIVLFVQCGHQTPPGPIENLPIGDCPSREGESGWIRLPVPNSVFRPGSIVVATQCNAQWVGHITDCKVPNSVVQTVPGSIGDWRQMTSRSYGANVLLKLPGVNAGPNLNIVNRVDVTEEDIGTESLNVIKLEEWLNKEPNSITKSCQERLKRPDTFIVGESVRLGSARYTLYDEFGARLLRSKAETTITGLEANAALSMHNNGELLLSEPVYTHIKNLRPSWDTDADPRFLVLRWQRYSANPEEPAARILSGDELFLAITSGSLR